MNVYKYYMPNECLPIVDKRETYHSVPVLIRTDEVDCCARYEYKLMTWISLESVSFSQDEVNRWRYLTDKEMENLND